ncbi:hypothetical protein PV458_11090 [Streptomyces sp. MN03-5084-2B]|nr:hypothetical protein [Streptomyces sp. MN03-5084-2B]
MLAGAFTGGLLQLHVAMWVAPAVALALSSACCPGRRGKPLVSGPFPGYKGRVGYSRGTGMTYGSVRIYRRDWTPEQVHRRVGSLAAAGMVLRHTRTGRITAISGEWETCGEQVEMDRESLLAAMIGLGEESFTFQYWMTDDEDADVTCTLTRIGDVVVEDYDLDGFGGPVYRKGQDTVIRPLLAEFRATGSSAVGLVVDRWGPALDTDLDDIVTGGPTPVTVTPELMVLRPGIARRNFASRDLVPFGDFLARDTDGILALAGNRSST